MALQKSDEHLEKAVPRCPYFGECGGCDYQDLPYARELRLKEDMLRQLLHEHLSVADRLRPIVPSPLEYNYRQRIDLKLQRTRGGVLIGFTPKNGLGILPIDECAIALPAINQRIASIKTEALGKITEKHRQANITIRTGAGGAVHWGGIGKHSMRMKETDYFFTEINGRKLYYALETFFQANLSILPEVISHLRALPIWSERTTFFDLYGGVGLFSMNLHDLVKDVYLIEQVKTSIDVARFNQTQLAAGNVHIVEGDVEVQLPLLMPETGESVGMIDPPRAGLSEQAVQYLAGTKGFRHLLYLSCNPVTLARDLSVLTQSGWTVKEIQPFDLFPKTKHVETLVHMEHTYGKK